MLASVTRGVLDEKGLNAVREDVHQARTFLHPLAREQYIPIWFSSGKDRLQTWTPRMSMADVLDRAVRDALVVRICRVELTKLVLSHSNTTS